MNTAQTTETHHRLTRLWHGQPPAAEEEGLLAAVVENHRQNFLIWHEEDLARRDDLPAERIREAKRTIDRQRWCIGFSRILRRWRGDRPSLYTNGRARTCRRRWRRTTGRTS